MQVIARPVALPPRDRTRELGSHKTVGVVHEAIALCLLALVLPVLHVVSAGVRPAISAPGTPASWLDRGTLLTVYGRGFGIAPVLGRLGEDRNLNDVAVQTMSARAGIEQSGGGPVRLALHLIYGLAAPCDSAPHCLIYLDDWGVNLVKQYIEPAARRGWLVILDDQLGSSTPDAELRRLMQRGYLRFDNVEVAFDPEFHAVPGQVTPGAPTGFVTASELNHVERRLSNYSSRLRLKHRRLLLVHEWNAQMIANRQDVRADDPYVQPVFIMDGIGTPADKASIYRSLLLPARTAGAIAGIKLFPSNATAPGEPSDSPVLTWDQMFGRGPIDGLAGGSLYLRPEPRVVVMT